jgi:uncharacterized membrane protein (DUF4010 family)
MDTFFHQIPEIFLNFFQVTLFALLIGLSQRKLHPVSDDSRLFGTDRTFTFIGILGFILYSIDPVYLYAFLGGGLVLSVFLGIYYFYKISQYKDFGLTTIVIALITYCLAPLVVTQKAWLYILVVVTVLIFTELKETFTSFSKKFDKNEFITLAKFLIIAGIILPIVPDEQIVPFLSLTPYKIWLAVVVISTISYLSYLIKKFVFPKSGIIISGILGGLYSSTATTLIMARKSRQQTEGRNNYSAAIILATAMMYLRVGLLMFIFNASLFRQTFVLLITMFLVSVATGVLVYFYRRKTDEVEDISLLKDKNPLEFKIALIFMLLFVAFSFLTYYAINLFGNDGLNALSLIVGVTDIDPFLITLFDGKYNIGSDLIARAAFQAIISNNILKLAYALIFSGKQIRKSVLISFALIITVNIILLFVLF